MSAAVLPVARTPHEAHLYLGLIPCERCGAHTTAWERWPSGHDGVPVHDYRGACAGCGASRAVAFAVPEESGEPRPTRAWPTAVPDFGGRAPSRLLDPGEWLLVADVCARAAGPDRSPAARESLATAMAAMEEVLKFFPPDVERLPEAAFWSPRGRAVYDREPGRFRRRRLLTVRDSYEASLAAMEQA